MSITYFSSHISMKTVAFMILALCHISTARPVVAIQPLGPVEQEVVNSVVRGITALYDVKVEVLKEKPLPQTAYHAPRDRHRADDIVEWLAIDVPVVHTKVIAITKGDISAVNDEGNDWGIMGLGQLGGRAAVISTFRLSGKGISRERFSERLMKVANHELGHTFGVDHCPSEGCLMQDKRGKVATIDAENGQPCAVCATRLPIQKSE